jgi:hypothetical protein
LDKDVRNEIDENAKNELRRKYAVHRFSKEKKKLLALATISPFNPPRSGNTNIIPNRAMPMPERVIAELSRTFKNRSFDKNLNIPSLRQ